MQDHAQVRANNSSMQAHKHSRLFTALKLLFDAEIQVYDCEQTQHLVASLARHLDIEKD